MGEIVDIHDQYMHNEFLMQVDSSSLDEDLDRMLSILTEHRDELIGDIVPLRMKKVSQVLTRTEKAHLKRLQKELLELAPYLALAAYEKTRRQQFVINSMKTESTHTC